MDEPSLQLQQDLDAAASRELRKDGTILPVLNHLNADTTWLLQLPRPSHERRPRGRQYYNILIDPWLRGPQSDVASWFSQQWHAGESKIKTILEVQQLAKDNEVAAGLTHSEEDFLGPPLAIEPSCIDVVVISHEFTDHCHKDTLLEVPKDVPIIATAKAANLIRSWSHFDTVLDMSTFVGAGADWRNTSISPLPSWLGISRLASQGPELLYYHSAVMIAYSRTSKSSSIESRPADAIIYTPHGILPDNLQFVPAAKPPIRTIALMHGLHDIAFVNQLNLGAHNGLKAQRVLRAKYWVGTHDEVKKGNGIVSWFLKRNVLSLKEALEREQAEVGGLSSGSRLKDIEDVNFVELGDGETLVLSYQAIQVHPADAMCFGRSLKADLNDGTNFRVVSQKEPKATTTPMPQGASNMDYDPPPGPPPNHQQSEYAPPPGSPPTHQQSQYAPPPETLPQQQQPYHDVTQPQHNWEDAVPDTSILPPPPSFAYEYSPYRNAPLSEALRAHKWCDQHALDKPRVLGTREKRALEEGDIQLIKPKELHGDVSSRHRGAWTVRSKKKTEDACLLSAIPLYSSQEHSPLQTEIPNTIYYEAKVTSQAGGPESCGLSIGFVAQPYPTWRLPGWQRSSLGVHGDDGRRYIDDPDGGREFTRPFGIGTTVGIGMTFSVSDSPPTYVEASAAATVPLKAEVFFTRDGKLDGGWDLNETVDAQAVVRVDGIDGRGDVYAAVGVYGEMDFEVTFNKRDWLWHPK